MLEKKNPEMDVDGKVESKTHKEASDTEAELRDTAPVAAATVVKEEKCQTRTSQLRLMSCSSS